MPKHSKKTKKKPSVRVEPRASEDTHRPEKLGWSASDMRQWPKQKKCLGIRFLHGSFAISFFDLFKVSKINLTCSKSVKKKDLFKVSKINLTCSKSVK